MTIYLDEYDWQVEVIDEVSPNKMGMLLNSFREVGVHSSDATVILRTFDRPNKGAIYTDTKRRSSLILIGWSTSWKQECNTLAQELYHLSAHICRSYHIDTDGEPPAHITGEIVNLILDADA